MIRRRFDRQTLDESAPWYDAIYAHRGKNYQAEAEAILALCENRGIVGGRLADVGCGTGEHIRFFEERFETVGFDPSAGMLAAARKKCPNVAWVRATAEELPASCAFDVVTMLFSAVGYLRDESAVRQAIARFRSVTRPGGLILVEPALFRGEIEAPAAQMDVFEVDGKQIERATTAELRPANRRLEERRAERLGADEPEADELDIRFEYRKGESFLVEHHPIRLWTREEYADFFAGAGLQVELVECDPFQRGLLVALRPAS